MWAVKDKEGPRCYSTRAGIHCGPNIGKGRDTSVRDQGHLNCCACLLKEVRVDALLSSLSIHVGQQNLACPEIFESLEP